MMTGVIVKIVSDGGFFFIKGDDGQQYFAHRSSLLVPRWIYDIKEKDAVNFDPTDHAKGPRAERVSVDRLS
jgi:cold shock CspA family protein